MIVREGKILLAQRGLTGDQPGLWELPGGKVEPGESQPEALRRELAEELAIDARVSKPIASESRWVGGRQINLHAWLIDEFSGDPMNMCHQSLAWVTPADALSFALVPADIPLLKAFINCRATT